MTEKLELIDLMNIQYKNFEYAYDPIENQISKIGAVWSIYEEIEENFKKYTKVDFINKFRTLNILLFDVLANYYGEKYHDKAGARKVREYDAACQAVNCINDEKICEPDAMIPVDKSCLTIKYINWLPDFKQRPELLDDKDFILTLYENIWMLLKWYGLHTYYVDKMAVYIKETIDGKTRKDYMMINCKYGIHSYTCGRALWFDIRPKMNTRLYIFNTKSEYDDDMDLSQIKEILLGNLKANEERQLLQTGGAINYYYKYLKYKLKYLTVNK